MQPVRGVNSGPWHIIKLHELILLSSLALSYTFGVTGRSVGFVTTARVTHATPAASYAHVADREWETDALLPSDPACAANGIKDIAAQLVDENPAIKVLSTVIVILYLSVVVGGWIGGKTQTLRALKGRQL